ncbi:MAG: dihydrolipoamide acetyltransferase family protein, partial [Tepidisphaeraceae bacterium]
MPQQSDTMTEGTVVKWLKKEGDQVKQGDVIAEIETDKATMEMEAFESGTIAVIKAPAGTKVPVGQLMAVLATGKETVDEVKKAFAGNGSAPVATPSVQTTSAQQPTTQKPSMQQPATRASSSQETSSQKQSSQSSQPRTQVRGNAVREEEEGGGIPGGPLETGRAQSRFGTVQEPPEHTSEAMSREATAHVAQAREQKSNRAVARQGGEARVRVSPLAKRIAAEKGIDVAQIPGSGPGGRVVKQDVIDFAQDRGAMPVVEASQKTEARPLRPEAPAGLPVLAQRMQAGTSEVIPLSRMRSAIAKRLQHSKQTVPHFYETVEIDVEELAKLRARLNEQLAAQKIKLSLGDLIAKAIASALIEHPSLNSHFSGTEIMRFGDVNLGMAVALPEGLIVPVLRGVNHMGFREIRVRSADLVERARAQRLKQD